GAVDDLDLLVNLEPVGRAVLLVLGILLALGVRLVRRPLRRRLRVVRRRDGGGCGPGGGSRQGQQQDRPGNPTSHPYSLLSRPWRLRFGETRAPYAVPGRSDHRRPELV